MTRKACGIQSLSQCLDYTKNVPFSCQLNSLSIFRVKMDNIKSKSLTDDFLMRKFKYCNLKLASPYETFIVIFKHCDTENLLYK